MPWPMRIGPEPMTMTFFLSLVFGFSFSAEKSE